MKFVLILISTASFVVGAQAAERNALSLLLKSLQDGVVKEWNTAYPYCVSGSAQRWIFGPGCTVYFSRSTPESVNMQFGCPGMPQQNFDWNICGCTSSSIDMSTCTSPPDGLSLGTCKPSGSGDEFAVSNGCKDSYRKYGTGWLKAPCAEGELFSLDTCSCQKFNAVDSDTCKDGVNKEWSTAYPYCVSGSAQRWVSLYGVCDMYAYRLNPWSTLGYRKCPVTPMENFDWNICNCTSSSIDMDTCTSPPDGLSLGTCKTSGSGDEFAASYGCKDSYKKFKTGWLKAPCADGELFDLDKCSCKESVAVDTATCLSILGPILDCSPNDMLEKPTPPLTVYPWCIDDEEEQFRLNASLGCETFQTYKKDGNKCKGTCGKGKMFDWNICECAPEGQVDKATCTSPPDALHLGTCSPTGSGELFAVSSGCQKYFQKSGSGWFKKSCSANLLFDLDQCVCDFPSKVNALTCRSQSAAKRLLDLELAAEFANLI